jgi:hypothetical protein
MGFTVVTSCWLITGSIADWRVLVTFLGMGNSIYIFRRCQSAYRLKFTYWSPPTPSVGQPPSPLPTITPVFVVCDINDLRKRVRPLLHIHFHKNTCLYIVVKANYNDGLSVTIPLAFWR